MSRTILPILSSLLLAFLVSSGTATADERLPVPEVPDEIAVLEGNKPYLEAHAVGVQIYACNTTWTPVAPRADLYDRHGKLIGTHFGGPTWQANDGSRVVGKREAGVNVDPTAIDWLRLSAASTTDGRFGETTFIQRINTTGGRAPAASECDASTAGTVVEVPYTADYVFWKAQD